MIHSVEVTGDGSAKTLAVWAAAAYSTSNQMRPAWIDVFALTTNGGTARIGDTAKVTSLIGRPLVAGASQFFPAVSLPGGQTYSLTNIGLYIANGDIVSLLWDA